MSNESQVTDAVYRYIVWMCISLPANPYSTLNPDMSDPYTGLTQDDINNLAYDYSYLYNSCSDSMRLTQRARVNFGGGGGKG